MIIKRKLLVKTISYLIFYSSIHVHCHLTLSSKIYDSSLLSYHPHTQTVNCWLNSFMCKTNLRILIVLKPNLCSREHTVILFPNDRILNKKNPFSGFNSIPPEMKDLSGQTSFITKILQSDVNAFVLEVLPKKGHLADIRDDWY